MRKKIGFFGGTFDPIHYGHINLALEILEIHRLDRVLFCPAFCSPFKLAAQPLASGTHRLAMCQLALEATPQFGVISLEIERGGPSYTIDTLKEVGRDAAMHLILSDEALPRFDQWKGVEELIRLAPPLIGTRKERFPKGLIGDALKRGVTKTRLFEVSSTEIRERIKKKLYCGHLVPHKTLDYIETYRLYS